MKRILVTGANGQLGLAIQAVSADYSELSFVFTTKQDLDVTNEAQVHNFFNANFIDVCINAAAYTNVDKAEEEKKAAYLLNETAPRFIAEACKQHSVFFIHVSTNYVFDGTKGTAYTIEDQPNPINVYGASKLAGEKAVASVGGDYCIIRTSWLYSEYGSNFQTKIVAKGLKEPYLKIVDDLYGTPTYAPNLVKTILRKLQDRTLSKIVHLSDGVTTNWFGLAKKILAPNTTTIRVSANTLSNTAKRPINSSI